MPQLNIILHENPWPDLFGKETIHLGNDAKPIQVAGIVHGMESGKTSVMIRLDLPDGKIVLAETSLELFVAAGKALEAKYGPK